MASTELIEALQQLKQVARNPTQIHHVGQKLHPKLLRQQPVPIQERLLKALALAGLMEQATLLLQIMLTEQQYLPSYIAYTAMLSALRREGRSDDMYHWLLELTKVAQRHQKKSVHIMAMNLYLAALCDQGTPESIDQAAQWILQPEITDKIFGVPLDLASYNTILHGAAKVRNTTLLEAVWEELLSQSSLSSSLQPDIRSYNARLIATNSYHRRLEIYEELGQANLVPDRYTLDLLLLPMLLLEKENMWEQLLGLFITRHSDGIVRDAFSSFLNTLVQNGKLEYAQHLFDTYIASQWDSGNTPKGQSRISCLADSRHFNVLIDGYRRQAENAAIAAASKAVSLDSDNDVNNSDNAGNDALSEAEYFAQEAQLARAQGRTLFRTMKRASVLPDVYTLTSMMGLCECPVEVVDLLMNPKWQNRTAPAVIRSAITASGQLGDAGLACALFDRFAPMDKFVETSPRLWNVLLGALADCAEKSNGVVELDSAATMELLKYSSSPDVVSSKFSISKTLQGKTCTNAVKYLMTHLGGMANSQSYCVAAAALQYDPDSGPDLAMSLFRNATNYGIPADGRFVNAIFRCFGDKIDDALLQWKSELRQACLQHESSLRNERLLSDDAPPKNLVAAYNGLIHVCGRAQRPDIAVRLVYAMNREGIEPNDVTLNNYRGGKRLGKQPTTAVPRRSSLLSLPNMVRQYENVLYVECTKYNQYNKRMCLLEPYIEYRLTHWSLIAHSQMCFP